MKRYISAVLIPCLLMQLFGCYSFQNITIEELSNQKVRDMDRDKKHSRITNQSAKFLTYWFNFVYF